MANIKKFLDSDGLTILCRKFQDYPDNEILGTVINAIDNIKVNKVEGKDLSTNDYTNEDKEKLNSSITFNEQTLTESQQAQARANIGTGTSNFSGDYNDLTNKPSVLTPTQASSTYLSKTDASSTYLSKTDYIQSDWSVTNASSKAYIQNRPFYHDRAFEGLDGSFSLNLNSNYSYKLNEDTIYYAGTSKFIPLDENSTYTINRQPGLGTWEGKPYFNAVILSSGGYKYFCVLGNPGLINNLGVLKYISGYTTDFSRFLKEMPNTGEDFAVLFGDIGWAGTNKIILMSMNVSERLSSFEVKKVVTDDLKQIEEEFIPDSIQRVGGDIIISSSIADSTKKFIITVDDTGKPIFTDTSDSSISYTPYSPPIVTSEDAGKFLRVSSTGEWAAESISNAEEASF